MKKNLLIWCITAVVCGTFVLVGCNPSSSEEPDPGQGGNNDKDTTEVIVTPAPNPANTPEGAIAGVFRIADSRFIWFSQGNLQYSAAQGTHKVLGDSVVQGTWRFAEHQSDYVGDGNASLSAHNAEWIDLFGWGTSGWNSAADVKDSTTLFVRVARRDTMYFTPEVQEWYRKGDTIFFTCYNASKQPNTAYTQVVGKDYFVAARAEVYFKVKKRINYAHLPWETGVQDIIDTTRYYPLANATYSLTDDCAAADWGVYNAISNGGNQPNTWRTLTSEEWIYLFKNNPWTMATVIRESGDSILGMMLLPCHYTPLEQITMTVIGTGKETMDAYPLTSAAYAGNVYTMAQLDKLQAAGVVFLPAAGRRRGTVVEDVGIYGEYWSSTVNNVSDANRFGFYTQYVYAGYHNCRFIGLSVRLVQDIRE